MPQANDIATNAANAEAIAWYGQQIAALEAELAPWQGREIPAAVQPKISQRARLLLDYRAELTALTDA